jgi:precorrin-6B methylase 2
MVGRKAAARTPWYLRTSSEPGSRRVSSFFDAYPRFYESSKTAPYRGRLNLRYEAIFAENLDVFSGARVLDIASHDGRWSMAAIEAGAGHVTGIEGRESLVAEAQANFAAYGIEPDRYRFMTGDVFEVLAREKPQVDVVLCLGFLYHTLRYNELFRHLRDMNPRHLIIDTTVVRSARPIIRVRNESVEYESNAIRDVYSHNDRVLSGEPSISGLRRILRAYDFELERLSDWGGLIRDNPELRGVDMYANGDRITARCRSLI